MSKVVEYSNFNQNVGLSQAMQHLVSEKPYVCFKRNLQICDCNDIFVSVFRISKNDLISFDISQLEQNTQFIETVRKAITEGISTYHGKVLFQASCPEIYIEALLFESKSEEPNEKTIFCAILESESPVSENNPSHVSVSPVTCWPSYFYASVSVHNADGSVIYISPSIEALLGYTSSELVGSDPYFTVYPDDIPIIRDVIEKLKSGSNNLNSRCRMVHKQGSVKYVESTSYLIKDAAGTANHIVNVTWDLGSPRGIGPALRFSEQKYYRLVMNLPVGVSLINVDGKLLEVNDSMKKIMRLPADLPIPELNFLNIEAMKRRGISARFSNCVETKEIVNGEIQFDINNNIHEVYLAYSFVPILDHSGNVESVIAYVYDLTDQKKAESESRERIDFLNLVINTIKTPFFVKDEKHKWVMLNDAAIEMMGKPREALIGKSDYDLFPKEQADVFWKYDELVFKSGSSSNEEQITWWDGTLHTIVTHKQLYVEKLSGKKFIVGTSHDITSYKEIEEELRASNTKYRELFDNANDFIITTDFEGKITNANRTLLNFLHIDLESIINRNVYEFIRDENVDFLHNIESKLLESGSGYSFELNAYSIDRLPVVYEVKASLIRQNGIPVGVQCIFSDITDRREASQKLEKYNESLLELNTTKDKFFSIIAHDLRNPFSSIIGFSEMLLEDLDELPKGEIRDALKIIHSAAKNSFNLLDNLLAWSRLETGSISYVPDQLVLTDVVEKVVNVLFSLAYRKKIEIDNLVKPDILLFADKNMLNTILNNLVMNAIKFTHIGGKIEIYSETYTSDKEAFNDFIKISVADTGIGMDTETCQKLFNSDRMASAPGTEKEQGTGLGLVLVREMVEKHRGKILVESEPGKGSVFSFLIPVYKPGANS